ncbi:TPA: hypothetical protein ACH3X1_007634 [Trebouxia sp. C0004]
MADDLTEALRAAARTQAEGLRQACYEFVKTRLDPPVKSEDEFLEFLSPFAKMALGRKVSPDETIVLVFDILRRMALIQQEVDKRTLMACMNLEMTTAIEQKEKDQPAALSGGEDTSMDHAEDGQEPAAEIEKEDDFVAAANARDAVVVNAIMSPPMSQSERTKAMMDYLQSRQASDYQPRSQNNAGRSKPIELFHGKPEQCGKDAKDWLSTVEIYLDSVNEKRPVPIVVTYLRGDAQSWWTQFGKDQIGLQASFAAFKDIFLARFVKPGDSRKARQELATMQQNDMSVETYATQFRNCAARIAASKVGIPVDSTTQATYFLKGLKKLIVYKLEGMVSPDVMQDIDKLIDAAEKVEANLDMSTKQAKEQPQNDRPHGQGRGQANYVDRNRGDNRYRPAP